VICRYRSNTHRRESVYLIRKFSQTVTSRSTCNSL